MVSRTWLRRPELAVAAFASLLQWLTLRSLLGPFIYADELGYVAAARYFGPGYPEVQMQSGFFHAGYGLLLSPLTIWFDEPASFHRAATSLNGAMLVVAAVMACRLAQKLYDLDAFSTFVVGALFASSTSVMVSSGLLWAESTLTLLVVLMATSVRRAAVLQRRLDIAVLALIAVAAYAIHPRGIAMTVAIVLGLMLLARSGPHRGTVALAVIFVATGFLATRQLHELTADRLFAGSALTGTNSSFRFRVEEYIIGAPGAWVRGLLGAAWYQLMASAGLVAVAFISWAVAARGALSNHTYSQGHGRDVSRLDRSSSHGSDPDGSNFVGFVVGGAFVLTWLIAGTIASVEEPRIDHTVYGRYLDHLAPLAFTMGSAVLLTRGRAAVRPIAVSAALVPVLGWAVSLWWGFDFYDEPRPVAPINAPVHATMSRVVENNLPGVIGTAAGVGIVAFWLVTRWNPRAALVGAVGLLSCFGLFTVNNEVLPQSRNSANLQALPDAAELEFSGGTVMLAEPFAFLPTYSGQFWADDVQFVLATECPAHPYDGVIAAPGDARYLDHRILFSDDRSERELLEPSPVGYPVAWSVVPSVSVTSGQLTAGGVAEVEISITNTGSSILEIPGEGPRSLLVAYRIIEAGAAPYDTAPIQVDGLSNVSLEPSATSTVSIVVPLVAGESPLGSGEYDVVADLYVRGLGWLHEAGCPGGLPEGARIEVEASP